MPAGAPSYLNALTDTRRCLSCTIIIRGKRKCVNPLAAAAAFFLRGCAETATAREQKATPQACSTGRKSGRSGVWGGPNERFGKS